MNTLIIVLASVLSAGTPAKADVVVAKDGSGDFTSIQAAINSVRSFRPEGRSVIYVRNGVYEEKVVLHSHKSEISLIGEDAAKTVPVWHDHANMPGERGESIGTFETYTLRVDGPDFILGPATCWFEQCVIHELRKGAYYTAASTAEPGATGLRLC